SYHMDFGAKAGSYVDTFMDVIRWNNVERLFLQTTNGRGTAGNTRQLDQPRRRPSCVLFPCLRFAPWRRLAVPPAPRRSTGRRSMKRSDGAPPSYPATCTATDFPAPTSR